jgi:hypothetical protein
VTAIIGLDCIGQLVGREVAPLRGERASATAAYLRPFGEDPTKNPPARLLLPGGLNQVVQNARPRI